MKKTEKKLNYEIKNHEIIVELEGGQIVYEMQDKENYAAYCMGAATTREWLENLENLEASTHTLKLKNTNWDRVIHGFVERDFYLISTEKEGVYSLEMRFQFTGLGNSPKERFAGVQKLVLGTVCVGEDGAILLTDDGIKYNIKNDIENS